MDKLKSSPTNLVTELPLQLSPSLTMKDLSEKPPRTKPQLIQPEPSMMSRDSLEEGWITFEEYHGESKGQQIEILDDPLAYLDNSADSGVA